MVGFGSSLRIARRPGWESAYLDYETLKLLLSQIEAVYEEEGHRRRQRGNFDTKESPQTTSDYRDELFLESDSDEAYASVDDEVDDDDYSESAAEGGGGGGSSVEEDSTRNHHRRGASGPKQPFFMSYSDDRSSSEDEGAKNDGCGAGVTYSLSSWTTWDKSQKEAEADNKRNKKRRNISTSGLEEEDAFYMQGSNMSTTNAFYLAGTGGTYLDSRSSSGKHSLLNAPVMLHASEATKLLPPATPAPPAPSFYTFSTASDSSTPPRPVFFSSLKSVGEGATVPMGGSETGTKTPPLNPKQPDKAKREEDRRQRRLRRRRLRARRRAQEKKVPRHLRLAHAKARAIVERFLGLLRAETEKVLLFAQSRLGELADTAGSLRFPSLDDHDHSASSFHYPLADGGLHPSASSSDDDEGAPGDPWSDSSNAEENSQGSQRLTAPHVFSGLTSEDLTGRTGRSKATSQTASQKTAVRKDSDVFPLDDRAGVLRQILHFTELRQRRPIFLRNDQILGEDMLLMSAVEEADGYTAVGAELMHVLRFILVNLLAVKKICKKHDRLLMQRMLGGYYQRTRAHHDSVDRYSHIEDAHTLGGLVARVSGDIYDAHPALIGHMTHYKLIGVYDRKIQKLANSRTVQVVSSCVALALSEYEVARSRADALNKLNSPQSPKKSQTPKRSGAGPSNYFDQPQLLQPVLSEDEGTEGPPTTESIVSLTRLRYTVTSIFALREAAREKVDHFGAYLSRSMLTFTGRPVRGEGLDGCSRETLDFLVSYNPDSALLLDTDSLYRGLYHGKWMTVPMSDVMVRTLATGLTGAMDAAPVSQDEAAVASAVSVDPESRQIVLKRLLKGQQPKSVVERTSFSIPDLPPLAFRLNRVTCFLYMMNYFAGHATTNSFVRSSGASAAYTSLVIGAPNVSSLIVAIIHTLLVSKEYIAHRFPSNSVGLLRGLFAVSCLFGVVGNVIHGIAVDRGSVPLAILGRFVFGFSSCDILHRQLVGACVPSHVVAQSAHLVHSRITGILAGLLIGVLIEVVPFTVQRIGIRSMQTSSWLMVLFWLTHLIRTLVQFRAREVRPDVEVVNTPTGMETEENGAKVDNSFDSDSSDSHRVGSPSFLYQSSSAGGLSSEDPLRKAYGGSADDSMHGSVPDATTAVDMRPQSETRKGGTLRPIRTYAGRMGKLLRYNIGIPLTLFLVLYSNYALELYLSGTSVITCRYFGWSGIRSGIFLGGLCLTILPINLICEFIGRRYEERTVLKRSIQVVVLGLLSTVNFVSLFSLATRVPKLLLETDNESPSHPYDWKIGMVQYSVGLPIAFIGLVAMEGASLSILSKLSPPKFKGVAINIGTVVVFVGFISRLIADLQLFFVGLSHRLINTDIVNAIAIPLILAAIPIGYFVKKRFFYLM